MAGPKTRMTTGWARAALLPVIALTTVVRAAPVTQCSPANSGYSSGHSGLCEKLDIMRRYARTDGIYELTNRMCSPTFPDRYYERVDNANNMYFYRLDEGQWAVFTEPCSENTYGITKNVTSLPWTTSFEANHPTIIACLHLEQQIEMTPGEESGEFSIPFYKHVAEELSHRYDVTLPDTVARVNFTIVGECGATELRSVAIAIEDGCKEIPLLPQCDSCKHPQCRQASYTFPLIAMGMYRGFRLTVNVTLPAPDGFSIQYELDHIDLTTEPDEKRVASTRAADIKNETIFMATASQPPQTPDCNYRTKVLAICLGVFVVLTCMALGVIIALMVRVRSL